MDEAEKKLFLRRHDRKKVNSRKVLVTMPKSLVEELDSLYPAPRYQRSEVIVTIVEMYLNKRIMEGS